jgi:hypothetical protein
VTYGEAAIAAAIAGWTSSSAGAAKARPASSANAWLIPTRTHRGAVGRDRRGVLVHLAH